MIDFHSFLRQKREDREKTQQEVADAIGVSLRTYQRYEEKVIPKYDKLSELAKLLDFDVAEALKSDPTEVDVEQYTTKRRKNKLVSTTYMVPFVPVKAQAGYTRAQDQSEYLQKLEHFPMLPGVDPSGASWRYWEIEGDSMEPEFSSGDQILTSQIHQMDWDHLRNFYCYVIVTEEKVLFKRVFCKNNIEWVLISVNEDQYPQQILPVEFIKEVWVLRRIIKDRVPTTKMYEIKV